MDKLYLSSHHEGLKVILLNGKTTNLFVQSVVVLNAADNSVIEVYHEVNTYARGSNLAEHFSIIPKKFEIYASAVIYYNQVVEQYGKK